jgi:hypothetical protein
MKTNDNGVDRDMTEAEQTHTKHGQLLPKHEAEAIRSRSRQSRRKASSLRQTRTNPR